MSPVDIDVQECNSLGRVAPELLKRMHTMMPGTPAWADAYWTWDVVQRRWQQVRAEVAANCAPWFDGSAFSPLFSVSDRIGITPLAVMLEANRDDADMCEWLRTAPVHAELPIGGGAAPYCVIRREA